MPELPEAEIVATQLRCLLGARITGWWLRRPDIVREGLESLDWYKDAQLVGIQRRGKSVVLACAHTTETRYVVAELGMTGLLLFRSPADWYHTHTHLILTLSGGQESELRYWNPRRFGRISLLDGAELSRYLARRFGQDPLTMSWPAFRALLATRRRRLKPLLMHQQMLAGVGNIYANEILHRARLHPHKRSDRLREKTVRRLFEAVQAVLTEAIAEGGSTVRDFVAPDGSTGHYQVRHRAYGRAGQPCLSGCGGRIRRLAGERTAYYCPTCQRP